MSVSSRILNGSITKGSSVTNVGLDTVTGSLDAFRQGVNIRDVNDLVNFVSFKLRPNSSFITTFKGKDLPENIFDDTLSLSNISGVQQASSTTAFSTGSISKISIGGNGKIASRLTHVSEVRDLGQSEYYIDDFFIDQPKPNPTEIVSSHRLVLELPERIVDATDVSSFDGVIEPLDIRRVADRSSTEMPYIARSIKGSMSGEEDKFKNVAVITDEVELEEIRNPQTVFFLDAVEHFGTVDLPGVQNINTANIAPYVDTNDAEITVASIEDVEMRGVLMRANYVDDDAKVHEITARRGFIFHYSDTGYDSIAYGGLKK